MSDQLHRDLLARYERAVNRVDHASDAEGIRRVDGEYTESGSYFRARGIFVYAREAFATEEEAQAKAMEMAKKKAVALAKQAKTFGDPGWRAKVVETKS